MNRITLTQVASFLLTAGLLTAPGCFDRGPDEQAFEAETDDDGAEADDGNGNDGNGDDGNGDGGNGNGDDGGAGDDGDDDVPCPATTHTCTGEIWDGWSGPAVVSPFVDGEAPDCAGEFSELVGTFSENIFADPAQCSCECGEPQNAQCGDSVVVGINHGTQNAPATCGGSLDQFVTLTRDACQQAGVISPGSAVKVVDSEIVSDGCEPIQTAELPPIEASGSIALCQGATYAGGCEDGEMCVEKPDDTSTTGNVCMWKEGNVDCPPGPYQDRTVYYTGANDTRACSDCSCGGAEGTCAGNVAGFESLGGGCVGTVTVAVDLEAGFEPCEVLGSWQSSLWPGTIASTRDLVYQPQGAANAWCDPSPAQFSGDVRGTDPITVCCA